MTFSVNTAGSTRTTFEDDDISRGSALRYTEHVVLVLLYCCVVVPIVDHGYTVQTRHDLHSQVFGMRRNCSHCQPESSRYLTGRLRIFRLASFRCVFLLSRISKEGVGKL